MLKPLVTASVAATAALTAQGACANGFYISGAGSAVQRNAFTDDFSSSTDPFGNRAIQNGAAVPYRQVETTHYKAGGEADIAGGYQFGLGRFGDLRAEAEFSFRDYQVGASEVRSRPGQIYGTVYNASITTLKGVDELRYAETVNAFYDLPRFGLITPYVGAGVGYQEGVETPGDRLHAYQTTSTPTPNEITGPAGSTGGSFVRQVASSDGGQGTWQVEGAVSLPLTARLSLVPAYRYTQGFHGHDGINVMRVGLRYGF